MDAPARRCTEDLGSPSKKSDALAPVANPTLRNLSLPDRCPDVAHIALRLFEGKHSATARGRRPTVTRSPWEGSPRRWIPDALTGVETMFFCDRSPRLFEDIRKFLWTKVFFQPRSKQSRASSVWPRGHYPVARALELLLQIDRGLARLSPSVKGHPTPISRLSDGPATTRLLPRSCPAGAERGPHRNTHRPRASLPVRVRTSGGPTFLGWR